MIRAAHGLDITLYLIMKNFKSAFLLLIVAILFYSCSEDAPKETPVISWENPEDIIVGAPLSESQLNATTNIAGTFVYTPDLGTILDEGLSQELSVEFTPADQESFSQATQTAVINVNPGGVSSAQFNSSLEYGSVLDASGYTYKTIPIGNQTWMAENLRTVNYRNGEEIDLVIDNGEWIGLSSGAFSNYENTEDLDEIATHGRLYNWFAVTDTRNIAPEGWHVATAEDWNTLATFLGGEAVAGGKLKESGAAHWNSPNTGANNSSGFTALPSGRREYVDGSFINTGFNGFWWTSTAYNPDYSWYRQLNYDGAFINPANFHKQYGFAVRCVKDAE